MEILTIYKNKGCFCALILIACLVISCTKKAKIKLPPQETKLVLTCFITPGDSLITAFVRTSTPKYSSAGYGSIYGDLVTNAIVVLSDGLKNVTLTYDSLYSVYYAWSKDLPILEGKTYYLNAATPDGKKASANTTVPLGKLEIKTFDVFAQRNDSNITELNLQTIVADIPDITNYIEIIYQTYTNFGGPGGFNDRIHYFDDDEKMSKTEYAESHKDNFLYYQGSHATTYLSVLNCSKEFYLYNKSVEKASYTNDNPFSDPVLIYTNINNGFGCFGSFVGNYANKEVK
jgi:hypothetical protein